MTLSEYLTEAVAKRTTGKYPFSPLNSLEYDNLIKWLDNNGFSYLGNINYTNFDHLRDMLDTDELFYYEGEERLFNDKYITIHTKDFYKLCIWYTDSGTIKTIQQVNDFANINKKKISEKQAIGLINSFAK